MKFSDRRILAAFVCGLIVGLVAMRAQTHFRYGPGGRNSARHYTWMLDRFTSKLKLDADQKQKVGAILESSRKKIDSLRSETRPRVDTIRNETNAAIRKILTTDQQGKFDKMHAEWEERWKKRRAERDQ